jgi:hypothetical protein
MPTIFVQWWRDPVASSGITIAIIAGIFAVYQLRAVPRERRRRILDEMTRQYASTAKTRGRVLRNCPMFMKLAYERLSAALDEAIARREQFLSESHNAEAKVVADVALTRLNRLKRESVMWNNAELGISYTSAAEVLQSEFKLRSLLWCVETLQNPQLMQELGVDVDLYKKMESLVGQLNAFALDYENGSFPPRTLFGQLHGSIAPIAKALEPIIWERSITNGRWGRRVLRLGLAAQHFNDVMLIHRSSDLIWSNNESEASYPNLIVHPALAEDIFGEQILRADLPGTQRVCPSVRMQFRTAYWSIIGRLSLTPSSWLWSFGGRRLRRHAKVENYLAACLRYALTNLARPASGPISLSFDWDIESLKREMTLATEVGKEAMRRDRSVYSSAQKHTK